jgi:hypothetical protein
MANEESTRNRLDFAKKRLIELKQLNNGNIHNAISEERQQLIQEFFFHLVGSIDFLLQVVNQKRNLGIPEEKVDITQVSKKLSDTDPIKLLLRQLHPNPRGKKIQGDIYSEDNNHLRIMLFRHRVCHYGDSPFHLRWGGTLPQCSLFIDPRDQTCGGSEKHVFDELDIFLSLICSKNEKVLQALK